jgi:hypothetical protein
MRVEATVLLQYEIPDDQRTLEAYDASDMDEVRTKERALLEEDEGDYLITQIGDPGTRVLILSVIRVPEVRP